MRYVAVFGCFVILALIADSAVGQNPDRWLGERVMVKDGAAFRVGGQIVGREKRAVRTREGKRAPIPFYRVERVNPPWLWLVAEDGGIEGWFQTTDAVTINYAIDTYTLHIRLNPHAKANYKSRGDMWLKKEAFTAALADYDRLIQLDAGDAESYVARAVVWQRLGNLDKAMADLSLAIRFDPASAAAFTERGNLRYAMEQDELALADYNEAIRLDPNDPWAHLGRGNVRFFRKAFQQAISDYNVTIQRLPHLASAYAYRGDAWDRTKRYDYALADYAAAIRLDPKCKNAYLSRASLWASCPDLRYRDGSSAVASATRACRLGDWRDAKALAVLAAAYAETQDYDQAVVWQTRAVECSGNDVSKRERLASLESYRARNKPAKANSSQ